MSPESIKGYLLTKSWRDTADGIELEYWFSSDQGPLQVIFQNVESVFFLARDELDIAEPLVRNLIGTSIRDLQLQNFSMNPVVGIYCLSYRSARQLSDKLLKAGLNPLESDINPADRYLSERFITSAAIVSGSPGQRSQYLRFVNPIVKSTDYSPSLRYVSLDIECSTERLQLYSIAVLGRDSTNIDQKVFILGEGATQNYAVTCSTQRELLQRFLDWLKDFDPDVVVGWNVIAFDYDYLQKVADSIGQRLPLGRAGTNLHWRKARDEDSRRNVACRGRVILDGINLLKAAFYSFDSFSLDHVSTVLLSEKKLIQSKNKVDEIDRLFQEDKTALAKYNLHDCHLVDEIFRKTNLMQFAQARAKMTGLTMDRMGGSVASFDNLYLPRLHRAGYVAPRASTSLTSSPGGYVLDSMPGIYEHVIVLDFKSLYPSIIRTFFIDPLGLATGTASDRPDSECVAGFLEARFAREGHILPALIHELWTERDTARQAGNTPLAQATKIIMNSFYGVLGSPGCRFFDTRLASSITLRGHQILQRTRDYIESTGQTVIYGDTDSVFVWIQEASTDSDAIRVGNSLEKNLNRWWTRTLAEDFNLESVLELEFETHYKRFLMPTVRGSDRGSKKRYAGIASSPAGDQLIFKGLERVRSDWTVLAKNFQEELYRRIFYDEEYELFVKTLTSELLDGLRDDDLVYRKKLRKNLREYERSTPQHVKAGKLYQSRGLNTPRKGDTISYVMTVDGPEPASKRQSPIDYQHYIERQLKPVADSVLSFKGKTYESIINSQLPLF